jgi:hypothetical protein
MPPLAKLTGWLGWILVAARAFMVFIRSLQASGGGARQGRRSGPAPP